jgi:prophage antirepressor-like protein
MHALVVRVSLSDAESARKTLTEQVVPAVSQSPGFVAGYWTWSDDQSNGQSMIVFESQEAAQTVEERIRDIVAEGATVESTEVRQVVASA